MLDKMVSEEYIEKKVEVSFCFLVYVVLLTLESAYRLLRTRNKKGEKKQIDPKKVRLQVENTPAGTK